MTPLHLACIKGHVEAVNLILLQCFSTSGATRYDVLVARDKECNTPLHLAMEHGHKELAVDLLNFHWELANLSNDLQQTPLHLAAKSNWIDVIDLLLERLVPWVNNIISTISIGNHTLSSFKCNLGMIVYTLQEY